MNNSVYAVMGLCFNFSCADDGAGQAPRTSTDVEPIESTIAAVEPLFERLKSAPGDYTLSLELARDPATSKLAILNFRKEDSLPVQAAGGKKYTVSCTSGGKTTATSCDGAYSCGTAVSACLDSGGCAEVCKAPMTIQEQRDIDREFLEGEGLASEELSNGLPSYDVDSFQKAVDEGTVTSVTISTVSY